MSRGSIPHPVLRLADAGVVPPPRPLRARDGAVGAVTSENRSAARLSPDDARWALATATATAIEGRGMLSPERRRRLVSIGARLGLRPFDANLVIAIVQDGARTGHPLTRDVAQRVALVPGRERRDGVVAPGPLVSLAISVVLGALLLLLLLGWISG